MSATFPHTAGSPFALPLAALAWAGLHAFVLHDLNFSWPTAWIDSAVSNALLFLALALVLLILRFYTPQKNRIAFLVGIAGALSALWLVTSRSILMLVLSSDPGYGRFLGGTELVRAAVAFLVIGCGALTALLWQTANEQKKSEARKAEAERLSRDTELLQLRQQLQPHFLFNSLNSINALIVVQPARARTMVQQLSDFLRGTLRREDHQWVSLEDELQHLELYLEIEKVRFGHRLSTSIVNHTEPASCRLPAMLLQPVMENAIKFGLYDTTGEITIELEARSRNRELVLEVRNPFDPETASPRKGTGFGLGSVQRRLYLLFARHDLLTTDSNQNIFITRIKIPQPHDPHSNH